MHMQVRFVVVCVTAVFLLCNISGFGCVSGVAGFTLRRRSAVQPNSLDQQESAPNDIMDFADEYPTVNDQKNKAMVTPKRTAILLDQIMIALHKALENENFNDDYVKGMTNKKQRLRINSKFFPDFGIKDITEEEFLKMTPIDIDVRDIEQIRTSDDIMGLQRRGHGDGLATQKAGTYWRCYFNAVTCF